MERLQIFFGDASPAEARIYARLAGEDLHGCTLSGRVSGPTCLHAKTLPASFRLVDHGPGATLLAEAIVPDPCFWSPELPFLYQVEVELRRHQTVLAQTTRILGLRPVGARGKRLHWEGKNWVLRGVARELAAAAEWSAWRETLTAQIVEQPDEMLLAEASRLGVAIVATCLRSRTRQSLSSSRTRQSSGGSPRDDAPNSGEFGNESLRDELIRVSRFPAVMMFVTDSVHPPTREWRSLAPNVLLGQCCEHDLTQLGEGAHVAWLDASSLAVANPHAHNCPVIVYRSVQDVPSLLAAREFCDQLQSEVAPQGECAGYTIVSSAGFAV